MRPPHRAAPSRQGKAVLSPTQVLRCPCNPGAAAAGAAHGSVTPMATLRAQVLITGRTGCRSKERRSEAGYTVPMSPPLGVELPNEDAGEM
jgi:hypothetical protein